MGPREDELAVTISEMVADELATPIEELPPLSDAIDLDALGAIVSSKPDAQPPDVTVTFEYASLEIFVYSDRMVYAQPISSWPNESENRDHISK